MIAWPYHGFPRRCASGRGDGTGEVGRRLAGHEVADVSCPPTPRRRGCRARSRQVTGMRRPPPSP
ncbi:predicted protein [Streptomyces sp. AA4]|nr:predicted protein [Streptomyces sp. AA4]